MNVTYGGNTKSSLLKIVKQSGCSWLARSRPTDIISLEPELKFVFA
jgi:hypothetical protein